MQLTNILRDVGEDLGRNRIYLPSDEMAKCGYSDRELRAGIRNDAFRRLMQFQVARARDYYARGNAGIGMLDNFDVFENRAVVTPGRKYWLTARNLARPIARHSATKLAFWKNS